VLLFAVDTLRRRNPPLDLLKMVYIVSLLLTVYI